MQNSTFFFCVELSSQYAFDWFPASAVLSCCPWLANLPAEGAQLHSRCCWAKWGLRMATLIPTQQQAPKRSSWTGV